MNESEFSPDTETNRRFAKEVARRDVLGLVALWSFLIAGFAMMVGLFRLPMPSVFPERGSKFRAGSVDRFPKGTTTIIQERNVLVAHDDEGIYAMSLVCTHLGCIIRREPDDSFTCPCHGSQFDSAGKVTQGPAPTRLRTLDVSLSPSGDLLIDRSKGVHHKKRFSTDGRMA